MAIDPQILAECELFRVCSLSDNTSLAQAADEVRYDSGDEIYRERDASNYVYLIVSGMVGIYVHQPDGTMMACAILGPHRITGLTAFQFREARPASAYAIMPTVSARVPARIVQARLLENPDLRGAVYEELYHLAMRRWADVLHALTSTEVSFPAQEACPSGRDTRFLASANRATGEIRGLCQREFACSTEEGKGCPMAGKPAQEFHPIFSIAAMA
jgi:hypothetical protein